LRNKRFLGFSKVVVAIIIAAIITASLGGVYLVKKQQIASKPSEEKPSMNAAPKAPGGLSATVTNNGSVTLVWTDNSDNEDGFKIERKKEGGMFVEIAKIPSNRTTYSDTSVYPETTYYYRIKSYNSNGDSLYSNEVRAVTPARAVSFLLSKNFPSGDITEEKVNATPQIPQYSLPLKPSDICNYDKFLKKIPLDENSKKMLLKNGFVVIDTPEDISSTEIPFYLVSGGPLKAKDDFFPYYSAIEKKDIPVFVTADTLLHYYHILFDVSLMQLEEKIFFDYMWDISKQLLNESIDEYNNAASADLKEASKRNIAYLSVALELLEPKNGQFPTDKNSLQNNSPNKYNFTVPAFVKSTVDKEINLIEQHRGWEHSPIFIYKEDYSQYVPRGHYTSSEKLKNYFKALMWYGRMTSLIKGSSGNSPGESSCKPDGIISTYDAKIQTLQASLITYNFLINSNIQKKWSRMYAITSFMVGISDDLGPTEYGKVLKDTLGEEITPEKIEQNYPAIQKELEDYPYSPKIYSGLGGCQLLVPCPPLTDEEIQQLKVQAKELLNGTKGFRMMGQRFTLDSYLFSEIVSPYSGEYIGEKTPLPTNKQPFSFTWNDPYPREKENRPFTWVKTDVEGCNGREVRGFPRGLDIMALLGSKRAKEILKIEGDTNYTDYEKKFEELKKTVDSLSMDDWSKSIYMNWLYALRGLIVPYGKGYQTFMQTTAWQDKELNTALSSWTELKHDTILYTKQSYTMSEKGEGGSIPLEPCSGYVEPVPEFYSRLLTITKMTSDGLTKLLPKEEMYKVSLDYSLQTLEYYVKNLKNISEKELENKELKAYEYDSIKHFSGSLEDLLRHVLMGEKLDTKVFKTSMVADVHTDGNTKMVLEEGTGNIKTIIVAFKIPDGRIVLGAGPMMSYYEFKQPMKNRLTDEEWRDMLNGKHPDTPPWTKSFYVGTGH
jgi:hypothetical protein